MKKISSLIIVLITATLSYGQINKIIIGRWQGDTDSLTSMNHDTYYFFNNGKFVFEPDVYNGLNRIINIIGHYWITGSSLYFEPEYTKEVIGGLLIRSEVTTLSDTWEIVQGRIKIIRCRKTRLSAIIKLTPNSKIISIDNRKFYKINL